MSFKVFGSITNASGFQGKLKAVERAANNAALMRLKLVAIGVHGDALRSIAKQSFGSVQKRYNPTRMVVASKPGDAPNTDRGTLIQSIKFKINKADMTAVVGSNYKVASWLEFGTKHMAKRPWLKPAFIRYLVKLKKEKFKLGKVTSTI